MVRDENEQGRASRRSRRPALRPLLDDPPDDVELALQRFSPQREGGIGDEDLGDPGMVSRANPPADGSVGRDLTPTENFEALSRHRRIHEPTFGALRILVGGEKSWPTP